MAAGAKNSDTQITRFGEYFLYMASAVMFGSENDTGHVVGIDSSIHGVHCVFHWNLYD